MDSKQKISEKTFENLMQSYRPKTRSTSEWEASYNHLRRLVLSEGLPSSSEGSSSVRPYVWCIFLGVEPMPANSYLSLIHKGASSVYNKIRNDTFRTLATDPLFRRKVSEASLIRLLNSFVWYMESHNSPISYIQGMNVIAAPFLYTSKSETEAFSLFTTFISVQCPLYVASTLEGVHRGIKLFDKCLEIVDIKLYLYLQSKNLQSKVYAFPSILTFSACTPPLSEVLVLWDFLLAYGVYLNVLCVVAQLLIIRDDILHHPSPIKLLRKFPQLPAKIVIGIAVSLIKKIPSELYDLLIRHSWDNSAGPEIDKL
ncbi:uncharacterized protein T551_02841 [Pneumocystis jirovecii RU7]|uniref:Rab-GAP TBC domain-containing protein n=1 Tax=Pneumocystis jirovecii (strain RU7) TaxID=1408657 RepID=A0A0W4ZHM4_PNEJ7|nr:uncharacterized protein T551_02841 [Pneumocystis jirovecii RU7]KTW27874.1 hypothetical protein T551_02841 [Pneumocystis jirovecii RU7]